MTAQEICHKWIMIIGIGFHPDTRGKDYSPALDNPAEYEADMEALFACDCDPYDIAITELNAAHAFAFVVE